jgi:hypothetical protein
VLVLHPERAYFFTPLHEQQAPVMLLLDNFVQAAVQLPVLVEPASVQSHR